MSRLKSLYIVIFLCAVSSLASRAVIAAPSDGFVLTQWGRWTIEQAVAAIEQAKVSGARHVSILVTICQPHRKASEMRWCEHSKGESLAFGYQGQRILRLIPELRSRNLTFSFIPFMISEDNLQSRQEIFPDNKADWFMNYGDHVVELALFAKMLESDELIVASELTKLFYDEEGWRQVIKRVREVFSGHLTISTVAYQYQCIKFWDALDSIGISAYFPLSIYWHQTNGRDFLRDPAFLAAAWFGHKQHLVAYAKKHQRSLTFVEVGYPSTNIAALLPWDYEWSKRTLDFEIQKRCFEAFRRVWSKEPLLRAFRIWGLSSQPFEMLKNFMPLGKPAESPVRKLFAERAGPL